MHNELPDPVRDAITSMECEIEMLRAEVAALRKRLDSR